MMHDRRRWVMDTSAYIHLCRAGHASLIEALAPDGIVLVPADVSTEIDRGRDRHQGTPPVSAVGWAELVVLSEPEIWTQLQVKAQLAGRPADHLGECAVIAVARHRDLVAILDDRAAVAQADLLGVASRDTLWIVVEAYKELFDRDRDRAAKVVDDLLATGMYLPVTSGDSLFSWAYEQGLLP